MRYGDVFFWVTDQAIGHPEGRSKFHIYVCCTDHLFGETFLVVNKSVNPNDFPITCNEIESLTYNPSYVSCALPIEYTLAELKEVINDRPVARLQPGYLCRLREHVSVSRTMERQHRQRIVNALQGV